MAWPALIVLSLMTLGGTNSSMYRFCWRFLTLRPSFCTFHREIRSPKGPLRDGSVSLVDDFRSPSPPGDQLIGKGIGRPGWISHVDMSSVPRRGLRQDEPGA